jgi:hypothetical protein
LQLAKPTGNLFLGGPQLGPCGRPLGAVLPSGRGTGGFFKRFGAEVALTLLHLGQLAGKLLVVRPVGHLLDQPFERLDRAVLLAGGAGQRIIDLLLSLGRGLLEGLLGGALGVGQSTTRRRQLVVGEAAELIADGPQLFGELWPILAVAFQFTQQLLGLRGGAAGRVGHALVDA